MSMPTTGLPLLGGERRCSSAAGPMHAPLVLHAAVRAGSMQGAPAV